MKILFQTKRLEISISYGEREIEKTTVAVKDVENMVESVQAEMLDEMNDEFVRTFLGGSEDDENVKKIPKKTRILPNKKKRQDNSVEDVFDLSSKCCGANVVQRGGDEGTNHYECMKCGDACDTVQKGEWKPQEKKSKNGRECCGSMGPRHKKGCPSVQKQVEQVDMGEYDCDACNNSFTGERGKEQTCPHCGERENIWPKK